MSRSCAWLLFAVVAVGCDERRPRPGPTGPTFTILTERAPEAGTVPPPLEPPVTWARLAEPVTIGDLRVTCVEVGVSRVKVRDPVNGGEALDEEESFWVWLRIDNMSETKILRYTSWAGRSGTRLTDEHGNEYKSRRGELTMPVGAVSSADVRPGQTATDALTFEKPVDAARRFRLELPHPTSSLEPFRFEFYRTDFRNK